MNDEILRYFSESAAMLDIVMSEIDSDPSKISRIYLMDLEGMLAACDPQPNHVSTARGCIAYWQSKLDEILAGTADAYTRQAYNIIRRPLAETRIFALSMLISYQKQHKIR